MTKSSDSARPGSIHAIAELALIQVASVPSEEVLRRVVEVAKRSLVGTREASITVLQPDGRWRTMVFTGPLAVELDERQYDTGFGPCVDAARTGQTIVVEDSVDSTYGDFARVAHRAGIRRTIAIGFPISQRNLGALNLYSGRDRPLRADDVNEAEVFAAYAATLVNNLYSYTDAERQATHLRIAMESRAVIEQAKGIMMGRKGCTADEAFDTLRRISQHRNVKLREVAEELVHSVQHQSEAVEAELLTTHDRPW